MNFIIRLKDEKKVMKAIQIQEDLRLKVQEILYKKNDNLPNQMFLKVNRESEWIVINTNLALRKLKPYLDAEEYRFLALLEKEATVSYRLNKKEPVLYSLWGMDVNELIELANAAFEGKGDEIKSSYQLEYRLQNNELSSESYDELESEVMKVIESKLATMRNVYNAAVNVQHEVEMAVMCLLEENEEDKQI